MNMSNPMKLTSEARPILIVDDDEGICTLMGRHLERAGYTTAFAFSGQQAIDWLSSNRAALMLLDHRLPDMHGIHVINELGKLDIEVPFIVITGQGDERLAVEMMKRGALDYLTKNSGVLELIPSVIDQALSQLDRDERLAQAERALLEAEQRLAEIVRSLPIVLTSYDVNRKEYTLVIGPVKSILGVTDPAHLKEPEHLLALVHEGDREALHRALHDAEAMGQCTELEWRAVLQEDNVVWLSQRMVPVLDDDGTLLRIDSVIVDITQKKMADSQRQELETQLNRSEKLRSLGVLAGGIAHDFNNLLTIISGNAQFLRQTAQLDAAQVKAVADIETAARHATDMTKSLRSFSRPSQPQMQPIEANTLIKEGASFLRRLIPSRIDMDIDADRQPIHFNGDFGQMQQVLINLCVNSRDAIPSSGTLTLQARQMPAHSLPSQFAAGRAGNEDYIRIRVTDTGHGMDTETREKAFDPFFTTKPKDQGTGLGLAMVYRIVEGHGGVIDLQSTPGQGTTVDIYLPSVAATAGEPEPEPVQLHYDETNILLVNRDDLVAGLLRTQLEKEGARVYHCGDGASALQLARTHPDGIHVMIVEQSLSDTTGIECIHELRSVIGDVGAILLLAEDEETPALGDDEVVLLRKPFGAKVVSAAVAELLSETT